MIDCWIYLFRKVGSDVNTGGLSKDSLLLSDRYASFNTGMYTENYEDIFMLFEKNHVPEARQAWVLKGFFKSSAPQLQGIQVLPERPKLYEDPSDLIYDNRLPIRVNKDHILSDANNVKRLPVELQDP